jgi:hypothetical protein
MDIRKYDISGIIVTRREAVAKRIVELIHEDLNDRCGLHIDSCDEEVQKNIFDQHLKIVLDNIEKI